MSSITLEPRVINHFTHAHALTESNGIAEFTCDGCNKYSSSGTIYRCADCDYDLHEYCATCPFTLRTFSHPPHELRLVFRLTPEPTRQTESWGRVCNICEKPAEGLFYECEPCEFRVHPLCTKLLPQFMRHALHPEHPLELVKNIPGACIACGGACPSWTYCCFACGFSVHTQCIAATETMKQRSTQPSSPQYYGEGVPYYAYGQPPSSPQQHGQGVHFGYETAPSSPHHPGLGSSAGHRRSISCGGNETPKKNKYKVLKSMTRFGLVTAAQVMGLPGIGLLADQIQGSDDSCES